MKKQHLFGHALCIITVIVWATTFLSTKVLLHGFSPLEILFLRALLCCVVLFAIHPKRAPKLSIRQEAHLALTGFCGITLYYLFENIALSYTSAANVAIIVSAAPFFTALLAHIMKQEKRLTPAFLLGFLFAMTGIVLITVADFSSVHFNPLGDLLSVLAALLWAIYCILMKRADSYDIPVLLLTRKLFSYALLFMLPATLFLPFSPDLHLLTNPLYLGNLLYLGIVACALCFVFWNRALQILGSVTTSVYIYAQPVITVVASALLLKERLTISSLLGILLTMVGLIISENGHFIPRREQLPLQENK
jgi:drug/metabolite transporter (DMT)-like permease